MTKKGVKIFKGRACGPTECVLTDRQLKSLKMASKMFDSIVVVPGEGIGNAAFWDRYSRKK